MRDSLFLPRVMKLYSKIINEGFQEKGLLIKPFHTPASTPQSSVLPITAEGVS